MAFTHKTVSIAGAPDITFEIRGETCRAELGGAKLYAEACADGADLRLTDARGEVLADLLVRPRAHRNLTENVTDIGAALLWSHWRYLQADVMGSSGPSQPLELVQTEPCPLCDAEANRPCVVHPAFGKLYEGCSRRMGA